MKMLLHLISLWFCINESFSEQPIFHKHRLKRDIIRSTPFTTPERVQVEKYPIETHHVTTEDGYILTLHRIPHGRKKPISKTKRRPVVLLMHGLMGSSLEWLLNHPDKALGFMLADAGHDVWMANGRGNKYSRNHTTLSTNQQKFWMFSWHEMGIYDMPANIDYILNATKSSNICYVGFSMGCTILNVLMSERPEYNTKIKAAAMLAPSTFLAYSGGNVYKFSTFVHIIERVFDRAGIWSIQTMDPSMTTFTSTICSPVNYFLNDLCRTIFSYVLMDIDTELVNEEFLPVILTHVIAGGSTRTLFHFMQLKNSGRFQKYDYGRSKNLVIYNSTSPPEYFVNKTLTPVAVFSGKDDNYIQKPDVDRLVRELPNVDFKMEMESPKFSHFDFHWSKDPSQVLHKVVINFLKKYET